MEGWNKFTNYLVDKACTWMFVNGHNCRTIRLLYKKQRKIQAISHFTDKTERTVILCVCSSLNATMWTHSI